MVSKSLEWFQNLWWIMLPSFISPQEIPVLNTFGEAAYAHFHIPSNDKFIPRNIHHSENIVPVDGPDLNYNEFWPKSVRAHNHRFLLMERSFCADTRAGMARAH